MSEPLLERFLVRAKRAVGLRGTINVLVTSSRELRSLNSRFRGQDKVTDVLSFPPPPYGAAEGFAGDVAISADIATQNARRLGHSPIEEIKVLALHGVLHLAGYDHERDSGQMARREARLRKQLSLPLALIARNTENSRGNDPTTKRPEMKVTARNSKDRGRSSRRKRTSRRSREAR